MASPSSNRPSSPLPSTSLLRSGVTETISDSAITTTSETNYESEILQALSNVHVSDPGGKRVNYQCQAETRVNYQCQAETRVNYQRPAEHVHDPEDKEDSFNITCDKSATDSLTDHPRDISNLDLPRALGPEVNLQDYDLSEQDKKAIGLVQEDKEDSFNITCDISATDSLTDHQSDTSNSDLPRALGPEVNLQDYNLSEQDKEALALVQLLLDEARKLEAQTIGQSSNALWSQSRLNRLTASNFGLICKRRVYTEIFVKSVLTETKDLSRIPAIVYGLENEANAIAAYKRYMTKAGYSVKILESGFVVNPSFPWLGASPDGKILDSKAGFGLLEVKCPSSYRDVDPLKACAKKTFYCELVDGKPKLKRNHSYFYQVQGQMGICGALWCDFVVYTKRGMIVSRIEYDEDFWTGIMKKMTDFYMRFCLQLVCRNDST